MAYAPPVVVGLLAVVATGCVSVPPSAGLLRATPATTRLATNGAWVAKVDITDPKITNRDVVEEALTLAMAQYIGDAGYFGRVSLLPGKPRVDDYILRLTIPRYLQERSVHPAYFPAAVFTMTLYIWFGGPMVRDTVDLAGTLTVDTTDGRRVAEASDARQESRNVSFWSPQYGLPSGIEGRTAFVRSLLDKVTVQLRNAQPAEPLPAEHEGRRP